MIQGLVIKLIFNAIYKAIQKKHNLNKIDDYVNKPNELDKKVKSLEKRLKKYESALKKAGIIKEKKRLKRR
tara:strand:- start:4060 stop:4272 length:213 start_codon:yes stop_codon:yes gene_type:complete